MFSKACEYGIKAMIYIAREENKPGLARLRDIAKNIESPEAFTAKILQTLKKAGLLISSKGPAGGFALAKPANKITVAHVIRTIDGNSFFIKCVLGFPKCGSAKPCPIHHKVADIREELKSVYNNTTLDELTEELFTGIAFLKP